MADIKSESMDSFESGKSRGYGYQPLHILHFKPFFLLTVLSSNFENKTILLINTYMCVYVGTLLVLIQETIIICS